jgi:hypothetical protein
MSDSEGGDREEILRRIEECRARGEAAYDRLYEAIGESAATAEYSDAKEAFYDAISLARGAGLAELERELDGRVEHIRRVFHRQFS